ncbi:hypothetical protein [Floricoccus penangensis]|uniref:Uncharacterized protein n=1 Tax=Floricoccus penangensis TaxID=1859475 RepID=A0A9Q5JF94_9LACT|nr:hypothetical protein [Floricoccus penangensis]OFI46239.1 hypothetical protein BG262_04275 [Floricoccus penangensis]URZ86960.1 hypothetical protein KIW23_07700 [Floricoccus penangensis]
MKTWKLINIILAVFFVGFALYIWFGTNPSPGDDNRIFYISILAACAVLVYMIQLICEIVIKYRNREK